METNGFTPGKYYIYEEGDFRALYLLPVNSTFLVNLEHRTVLDTSMAAREKFREVKVDYFKIPNTHVFMERDK